MINNTHKHSVQPPLRLGGVRILEFWVLGGGQNSFDFKGLVYSVGGVGGESVHSPSYVKIEKRRLVFY